MALTKRSETSIVYLQAKHHCLWRELKKHIEGCDSVEVTNPKTKETFTKYGYRYDTVTGRALKLVKYDTEQKYSTRYYGFKLHLVDGGDTYVLDMPYQSQILRRFLRVARNVDWSLPLSITIFRGKKQSGEDELGVWFQQQGETVKPYYTREAPHGMPAAVQDPDTHEWDFKAQHRWLVEKLKVETTADIEVAAARVAPPVEPDIDGSPDQHEEHGDSSGMPPVAWGKDEITDDDVPF